jgi:hypothetical protein
MSVQHLAKLRSFGGGDAIHRRLLAALHHVDADVTPSAPWPGSAGGAQSHGPQHSPDISPDFCAHVECATPPDGLAVASSPQQDRLEALERYAQAAALDQVELATAASAHLHAMVPLLDLTDELVARMGPIYLRRLIALHQHRIDGLRRMILAGPATHASTPTCGLEQQQALQSDWIVAAAFLGRDARAGERHHTVDLSR